MEDSEYFPIGAASNPIGECQIYFRKGEYRARQLATVEIHRPGALDGLEMAI